MLTPMFKQYRRIKQQHQDAILLFRLGDFYEMFYEDAKLASRLLGLTLTSRSKGEKYVPMAGIPYHAADSYIRRLVQAGHKVAVCEQVQDPKVAKELVKRDVVRVITPGTLTEDALLVAKESNFLAAIAPGEEKVGLAWVELSTGKFMTEEVGEKEIGDELARLSPSECLLAESLTLDERRWPGRLASVRGCMVTTRPDWEFAPDQAARLLRQHFGVSSLEGFDLEGLSQAVSAAGALLAYLVDTQRSDLNHIHKLERFRPEGVLIMDRITQRSLELFQTTREGSFEGTLLWVLDETRTPMGGRLLRDWLAAPLRDVPSIVARQEAVGELVGNHQLRQALRELLGRVADIERLATRVVFERANPRDLLSLAQSARVLPDIQQATSETRASTLAEIHGGLDTLSDIRERIEQAITPSPPALISEGGLIREGYNSELDELRDLARSGKDWLKRFAARESSRTGIPSLKVGFNRVFGYYIEVTNRHRQKVPQDYVRRQTLKNAERFVTQELKEYEARVLHAETQAKELEHELFLKLRADIGKEVLRLQAVAERLARLDVFAALAQVAVENHYIKPEVNEGEVIDIKGGRHPVLEKTLEETRFVPNDVRADCSSNRLLIVTGPNMAGKSTYVRQLALLTLMAQMGSYLPATEAVVGVVDRIFTRVGATDEIMRGQSTFMVEMLETANILNAASRRSLIILDEIGRGTSTFDGVSIAWAVGEYIHDHIGARTLFATHYHELPELASKLSGVKNYNVQVREWKDEVIFLHKIVPGSSDRSYGIQVARLAGVPREVVARSQAILENLEKGSGLLQQSQNLLPSHIATAAEKAAQLPLFAVQDDPLVEEISRLNLDEMTPLEALLKLREYQQALQQRQGPE